MVMTQTLTPESLGAMSREVAAQVYAHAVWRTGDMTHATEDFERKLVERVYDEQVPLATAASWLRISGRWLRKLATRVRRRPAEVDEIERDLMALLRDRADRWFGVDDVVTILRDRGLPACEPAVLDLLKRLSGVGQVIEQRVGTERYYRAAARVHVYNAEGVAARKRAVMTRSEAIPEVVEQYVGGVAGASFSVYRYTIPKGREAEAAEAVRAAVSEVLRQFTTEAEASDEDPAKVTYLLLGANGWPGAGRVEGTL